MYCKSDGISFADYIVRFIICPYEGALYGGNLDVRLAKYWVYLFGINISHLYALFRGGNIIVYSK